MPPVRGRYVVLAHDRPRPHFDWMLERDGALATWRVDLPPAGVPPGGAAAERIADHRIAYLETEGEVSGGRGTVRRVEAGGYEGEAVEGGAWRVRIGGRLFFLTGDRVLPA